MSLPEVLNGRFYSCLGIEWELRVIYTLLTEIGKFRFNFRFWFHSAIKVLKIFLFNTQAIRSRIRPGLLAIVQRASQQVADK